MGPPKTQGTGGGVGGVGPQKTQGKGGGVSGVGPPKTQGTGGGVGGVGPPRTQNTGGKAGGLGLPKDSGHWRKSLVQVPRSIPQEAGKSPQASALLKLPVAKTTPQVQLQNLPKDRVVVSTEESRIF